MHPLARLLGWCLLVALLTGILWPERPDDLQAASMEVRPEVTSERPLPPAGRAPEQALPDVGSDVILPGLLR